MPNLLRARGPPPPPAEQVEVRTCLRERVAGGFDAIDPRVGIKDDLASFGFLIINAGSQGERAERNLGAAVRPGHAGVRHVVTWLSHLHEDAEPARTASQSRPDLIEQKIRGFLGGLLVAQVLGPLLRPDAE